MDAQAIGSTEHVRKQQEKNAKEEQRQREEVLYKLKIKDLMSRLQQPKIKEEDSDFDFWSDDEEPKKK